MKRFLPSSGRYKVEEYLPIYLWTIKQKKLGKSLFWELLSIVAEGIKIRDTVSTEVVVPDADVNVVPPVKRALVPCLYCGGKFGGVGGLQRHLNYCSDNPNASKAKRQKLAGEVKEVPSFPCLYCDSRFIDISSLETHLSSCRTK